ncbi:unnamed protein product [Vicia faba]|uniref:Uncharacterized protein n=1 Tax=Vicia faba TaxID=3906 RepID=A0AAV0ZS69_VICFA|nr:unnamed protein product [Vicia faba]
MQRQRRDLYMLIGLSPPLEIGGEIKQSAGRHYSHTEKKNVQPTFPSSSSEHGGKKIRTREAFYWFPNLLLLKAALSRLDVGPAYYEDPAFPSRAYLVLVLRRNKTDALRLILDPNKQRRAPIRESLGQAR